MKTWIQRILLQIVLNAVAILALQYFKILTFQGDLVTLLRLSAIIGLINLFLRPILSIITKPLIWITFGLFAIILNLILLKVAMAFAPELTLAHGFSSLVISSLVLGVANALATINK